jgi:hypothetical protein
MKAENALAGDWGWTDEQADLLLPRDERRFGLRRRSSKLHQNDGSDQGRNRHHRVHDDAKLAVIGVGCAGMQVRDLGKGERGKEPKAQQGNDRQEP